MSLDQESALQDFLSLFGENRYLRASALLVGFLLLAKLGDWVISRGFAVWARRTRSPIDDRFIEFLHRPILVSVGLLGLWLAILQIELQLLYQTVVLRVLQTVLIFVWMLFGIRSCSLFLQILSGLAKKVQLIQPQTLPVFEASVKIVLLGGALYLLLLTWGINVTAWLASAGIIGIAVGLAARDSLANLFSGISILADAPYEVGHFVVLESGERGRVTQIGLRSTRLLTRDDIEITVPNAVMANVKIVNETGGRWEKERIRVQVAVAHGSDLDQVRETLLEIARSHRDVSENPEPRVRFRSFGDSGLNLELLCWIDEPVLRGRVLDALHSEVYKSFRKRGIQIPFPQRDIYMRKPPGPSSTGTAPEQA